MTVDKLHDALSLLPGDLVAATDRLRCGSRSRVTHWRRWAALAACLVLVLSTGLVFYQNILPGMGGASESVAEAPAAMAPAAAEDQLETLAPAAEAEPRETIAEKDAAAGSASQFTDEKPAEEELCIDHSHSFAEESDRTVNSPAYCGNTLTTVYLDGAEYSFAGSDSVTITDILINLDYDSDAVCRCMAEFTVDTETLAGIEVNLTEGFARCEKGQAALTEEQAKIIREIIDRLQ